MNLIEEAMRGNRGEDQQRIATVGLQWIELLLKKNADYGSSVWQVPVLAPDCSCESAIRVRMSDKIQRLQSLLSGKSPEVAESINDTIQDLGAYCLLYLASPKNKESTACS